MIDTHCHLTFPGLRERIDAVIAGAAGRGVDRMICVGTTPDDARAAVALAEPRDGVYATAGLHPGYTDDWPEVEAAVRRIAALAKHGKVVALGEMGLDAYHTPEPTEAQRCAFAAQLALAASLPEMPVIIHNRAATDQTLAMIRDSGVPGERFVFHCFSGSADELDAVLATGAMVSFTGIVTFRSAAALAEASDRVPLERLMLETDAPYLTPEPHRKVRPNEPKYVADVADFVAKRRGMTAAELIAVVDANAERFFALPAKG